MTKALTMDLIQEAVDIHINRSGTVGPLYVRLPNGSIIEPVYLKKAKIIWNSEKQKFEPNEESWKKKLENRS